MLGPYEILEIAKERDKVNHDIHPSNFVYVADFIRLFAYENGIDRVKTERFIKTHFDIVVDRYENTMRECLDDNDMPFECE